MDTDTCNHDRTNISLESTNCLFALTLKEYEQCSEDKRDLDQKAAVLLASVGVIIGFVISNFDNLNPILMYLGCILLIFSAMSCVYELLIRSYKGIDADGMFNEMIKRKILNMPITMNLVAIADLNKQTKINDKIYKKLVKSVEVAIILFIFGVILLFCSFKGLFNCFT